MMLFVAALACSAAEPYPIETMLSAAENALQQNKPERARLMLDEAKKTHPTDGRIDYLYGVSYAQQEKNEEAITAYKTALQKAPTLRNAHLQLAMLYDALGRYALSEAIYKDATARFPKDGELFFEWGSTLILQKRFKEADEALRKALVLLPKEPQVMADLAYVELKLGRPKDAVSRFEQAFKTGPVEPESRTYYGDALAATGALDRAEAIYTEMMAKMPASIDLWYRRAKVREARGNKTGAAEDKAEWEKRKKP